MTTVTLTPNRPRVSQGDCEHNRALLSDDFALCVDCGRLYRRSGVMAAGTCRICGRSGIHAHQVTVA